LEKRAEQSLPGSKGSGQGGGYTEGVGEEGRNDPNMNGVNNKAQWEYTNAWSIYKLALDM
jgi:hypothetical protein